MKFEFPSLQRLSFDSGVANRPSESRVRTLVDEILERVPSLPWNSSVTHAYAELRSSCRATGKTIAELDMLIAAHAISVNATMVTHDGVFQNVEGLKTEYWA